MNSLARLLPSPHVLLYLGNVAVAVLLSSAAALLAAFVCGRRSAPTRHGLLLLGLVLVVASPPLVWWAGQAGIGRLQVMAREAMQDGLGSLPNITQVKSTVGSPPNPERHIEETMNPPEPARATSLPWWWTLGQGFALVWAAGTTASLFWFVWGLVRLAVFCQRLYPIGWDSVPTGPGQSPELHGQRQAVAQAAAQVGLARPPRLFVSAQTVTPVTFGLFRPAVVLPEGLADDLPPNQLYAVLLHEVAHVARHDPWVGLAQRLVAAFYWWCPLVHRLNRRLSEAREELCDNYVLRGHGDGTGFAEALVTLAERVVKPSPLPTTVSMFEHCRAREGSRALEQRIRRLLSPETSPMTRMNCSGLMFVVLAGLGMTVVISLSHVRAASEDAPGPKAGVRKSPPSPGPKPPTAKTESLANARSSLTSSPTVKRTVSALLDDTRFEFLETPFARVVANVKDRHGIAIQIDEPQLRDMGIGTDSPITRRLDGLSLHSSLQLILTDLGLTYVIREDALVITSEEESRRLAQLGMIHANDVKRELERSPAFRRKNAKIVNVLQDSTQIEFSSTPLSRAVKSIKDRHGIPIELDWREIDNVGVGTDARCTLNVRGVKLASALDKLVGDLGLTYVVEGEYILITAPRKDESAKDRPKSQPSPVVAP